MGAAVGLVVGVLVGAALGLDVGLMVGENDGASDGKSLGTGLLVGISVKKKGLNSLKTLRLMPTRSRLPRLLESTTSSQVRASAALGRKEIVASTVKSSTLMPDGAA